MLGHFLNPIQNVMELPNTLQAAAVAASRLRDILDRTKENTSFGEDKSPFQSGDITVDGKTFTLECAVQVGADQIKVSKKDSSRKGP